MILIGYINGRPAFVKAGYKLDSLGEFLQTKQTKKPVSKLHARQGKSQSPGNSNFFPPFDSNVQLQSGPLRYIGKFSLQR